MQSAQSLCIYSCGLHWDLAYHYPVSAHLRFRSDAHSIERATTLRLLK